MPETPQLGRRSFLGLGAATLGGVLLAACDSSSGSGPKRSGAGRVRVAAADTTMSSGLDIRTMGFGASYVVMYHLYDSLAYLSASGHELGLATAVTPNADATEWTVKIRSDAKFHNGAAVRAADVAFSIAALASAKSNRASVYSVVDTAKVTTPDATTVVIPLKAARGDFLDSVLSVFSPIVPKGTTDFSKGIGSGPFKLAGRDATTIKLVRNDAYWGPRPTIGELDIVLIADPETRLNAVKSGQVDYAVGISAVGAKTAKSNSALKVVRGGAANSQALSFAMNSSLAPFTDSRVRQAVRLAADRDALVSSALLGLGTPGNDVVGKGLAGYDDMLPQRTQDLAKARSLFRAAGVSKLTLQTAELVPGMTTASNLLVQQLDKAGVTLTLSKIAPQAYYADLAALSKRPFQAFYYVNRPNAVHLSAVTAPGSTFNVTGLSTPWWKQLAQAEAEVADTARAAAFTSMQKYLYASGGDLLWAFQEQLDAMRPGISGIKTIQSTPVFRAATVS